MPDSYASVLHILGDVLSLGERAQHLKPDSPLLGSIPEFDSMAVVSLITTLEERLDISIDDEEINAEIFATVGSLHAFVLSKLG